MYTLDISNKNGLFTQCVEKSERSCLVIIIIVIVQGNYSLQNNNNSLLITSYEFR